MKHELTRVVRAVSLVLGITIIAAVNARGPWSLLGCLFLGIFLSTVPYE